MCSIRMKVYRVGSTEGISLFVQEVQSKIHRMQVILYMMFKLRRVDNQVIYSGSNLPWIPTFSQVLRKLSNSVM